MTSGDEYRGTRLYALVRDELLVAAQYRGVTTYQAPTGGHHLLQPAVPDGGSRVLLRVDQHRAQSSAV